MAKSKAFAIKDCKVGIFLRPFFELHIGSALRAFESACAESQSPFAKFPNDFELYLVGEFDDLNGAFTPVEHQHVASAREFVSPRQGDLLKSVSG